MAKLKSVPPDKAAAAFEKVVAWFFAYPNEEFTLNNVYKEVYIAKTTVRRVVVLLVKKGFLTVKKTGKLWRISANQSHEFFITKKIPYNLGLIYESGIVEHVLYQIPNAKAITLFGSYRKGDDVDGSDVDIAVEVLGDKPFEIIELGTISQLGYRKNVKVNAHIFSRSKVDLNLFTNIANGIILNGLLEVRP